MSYSAKFFAEKKGLDKHVKSFSCLGLSMARFRLKNSGGAEQVSYTSTQHLGKSSNKTDMTLVHQ